LQARAAKIRGADYGVKTARLNQARLAWSQTIYRPTMSLQDSKQRRVSTVMREKIDGDVSERYQVAKWKWVKNKKGRKVQTPTLWLNTKTNRYAGRKSIGQARRRAREKYEDELLKKVYKLTDRDVRKLGKTKELRRALLIEVYKGPGGS
jgi:hypothetical protein